MSTDSARNSLFASRLKGARIVHVERSAFSTRLVLVFEHRGTDDDCGYLFVEADDIYFADGGDLDEWRKYVDG